MTSKNCEKCRMEFSCGLESQCWCAQLPAVGDPDAGECLCPSCLKAMVAERIDEAVAQFKAGKIANPAAPYASQIQAQSLIEGIDYYMDASGLMVFKSWYHLKRGSCCGNACRHCPYNHAKVQTASRETPT